MKLHSIMLVGAATLATAALATDVLTDTKTLGWMRVDSTLPITVVGVPWMDVSNTNASVKVADLVKTDTLTEGDKLYVYNDGTWLFYQLNASKEWEAGATANSSVAPVQAGTPDTATIARGQALYLERQNPTTPGWFYVYGADGEAISSTTLSGSTKYLVASPKATAFKPTFEAIVNATQKSRTAAGDQIVVPLAGGATRIYTLVSSKWGYVDDKGKRVTEDDEGYRPIQLGTGFWYLASSAGTDIVISW